MAWILPVFDSILWFTDSILHWNNGFSQRWSLSGLRLDIRHDSKFSTGYGCPKIGFNLEPNTDKDIRSETFYLIFWGFRWWNNCFCHFWPFGESCTLNNHLFITFGSIFSAFVPFRVYLHIIKGTLLDSFRIRIVQFESQQGSVGILFFKNRIGLGSKKTLTDHLWQLLAWSW